MSALTVPEADIGQSSLSGEGGCSYVLRKGTGEISASSGRATQRIYFDFGGATSNSGPLAAFPFGQSASISVCVAGGAFATAAEKLESIQLNGLGSSAEASSAALQAELAQVYVLEHHGSERLAARTMMYLFESKLKRKAFGAANSLLEKADMSKLSSSSVTGMMRLTHKSKKNLPLWSTTYARSWDRIRDVGENPEELFLGMQPPSKTGN
jgi:hypothetical protein